MGSVVAMKIDKLRERLRRPPMAAQQRVTLAKPETDSHYMLPFENRIVERATAIMVQVRMGNMGASGHGASITLDVNLEGRPGEEPDDVMLFCIEVVKRLRKAHMAVEELDEGIWRISATAEAEDYEDLFEEFMDDDE